MGSYIEIKVGDTYHNNEGDNAIVIKLESGTRDIKRICHLRFEDGTTIKIPTPKVRIGSWRNLNKPCKFGVGFIGYGKYRSTHRGEYSKGYRKWESMISRCYNEEDPAYKYYGGSGVSVCGTWHNYQNFADWFYSHNNQAIKEYHLDKDLLWDGTSPKLYSPETCCLIPQQANSLLSGIEEHQSCSKHKSGKAWYSQTNNGSIVVTSKLKSVVEYNLLLHKIERLLKINRILERNSSVDNRVFIGIKNYLSRYNKLLRESFDIVVCEL